MVHQSFADCHATRHLYTHSDLSVTFREVRENQKTRREPTGRCGEYAQNLHTDSNPSTDLSTKVATACYYSSAYKQESSNITKLKKEGNFPGRIIYAHFPQK